MQTRKLGNSDLMITPVGFGAWAIGGGDWAFAWGAQEETDSIAAIHRALELGVNWIDTAAVYGFGHSEKVVARALKTWKGNRPYIFTKCAMRWDDKGAVTKVHTAASIKQECEDSLKRLETDVIDLYQIHWPPEDNGPALEESWQAMVDLQKAGKVRWIGVSNYSAEQIERCGKIAPVTSDQPPYSMLRRKIESSVAPYCKDHNVGIIVYSPMLSGMLTGGMTRERALNLPANDWRRNKPEFSEPKLSQNLELVERLRAIGDRYNTTPGAIAVAWTLLNPAVTGAIVGSRSAKQAEGVMKAGDIKLTAQDIAQIEGKAAAMAVR
ncbi:MAG TPA: aldo/keto reductase [Candidatus Acidoferrum sp.]|nr:aldo/keto reductase [Candidatus Acidoferrum sp.]